jgi:hypothetical protein
MFATHDPPFVACGSLRVETAFEVITFTACNPASLPRLAYASRSWLHNVGSPNKTPSTLHNDALTRAGGVSPPWYELRACEREVRNPSHCNCRRGLQTHGGLTPAALDRMCVCASQNAIFHGRTIVQQSRAGA